MTKKIFGLILLAFLFTPATSLAAGDLGSKIPSLNPYCWHPSDCTKQGGSFFETSSGPCKTKKVGGVVKPEAWGRCLPSKKVETTIAIGGDRVFTHVGEYILVVYNYVVAIAGVLAVAVIIIAGLQWMTSGGNSDMIKRSQKRIGGAIIGLMIAYASYFILNNINPDLVKLRMPQVWMIRGISTVTERCSDLSGTTKLALASPYTNQTSKLKLTGKEEFKYSYEKDGKGEKGKNTFYCGKRFFVSGGGNAACFADLCPNDDVCVPFGEKDTTAKSNMRYICKKSSIGGTITYSGNKTKNTNWNLPHITNENDHELWALCKNPYYKKTAKRPFDIGLMIKVDGKPETSTNNKVKNQGYNFTTTLQDIKNIDGGASGGVVTVSNCKKYGGILGFALYMPMDGSGDISDDWHWIGMNPSDNKGIDLGGSLSGNASVSNKQPRRYMLRTAVINGNDAGWDMRFDAKYLIDKDWKKLGKGTLIKMDINADYIYYLNSLLGNPLDSKEVLDHYAKLVLPAYKQEFIKNKGLKI